MDKFHKELTTEKISKLLFKQSMPAIIGFVVLSLYYIVDTIFVGQGVGTLGIAGVVITSPIMMIIGGIAFTLGIGAGSIISRLLGAKKKKQAEDVFGTLLTSTIIFGVILIILCFIFIDPLLKLFGATETILPFAKTYMQVLLLGLIFYVFAGSINNVVRAEGAARFAMIVMLVSAIVNTIFDYLLIMVFKIGIAGAALATVIAEVFAAITILYYFYSKKSTLKIHWKYLKIKIKYLKEILSVGASTFVRHISGSIIIILVNNSLAFHGGDISIAAYGIISRILMFGIMPVIGIAQGLQPVIGYNYGAKKYKRAKETMIKSLIWSTILASSLFLLFIIFLNPIINLFTSDSELVLLTIKAAKIMLITIPVIGFQVIVGGVYQALGKAIPALIVSMQRQIILLIPLILILPKFFGLFGIFYSSPIADIISGFICVFLVIHEFKIFNRLINGPKAKA